MSNPGSPATAPQAPAAAGAAPERQPAAGTPVAAATAPTAWAAASAPGLPTAAGAQGAAADKFDEPGSLLAAAWPDEPPAWRALATAWQAPLPEGEICTRAAPAVGLACYRTRGGLATVRQLDRPGLVLLRQREEPPVVALLVALDERGATLQTQGRHWRLSLPALASVWRGDFATLWRPPPSWREPMAAASAPALPERTRAWVQERLAGSGLADANKPLRDQLWAFQVAQGLPPDGRPGPMTLMQLSRGTSGVASGGGGGAAPEPVLLAQRPAGGGAAVSPATQLR